MRAEVAGHSACRVVLADEARGARDKERNLSVVNLEKKNKKNKRCVRQLASSRQSAIAIQEAYGPSALVVSLTSVLIRSIADGIKMSRIT